MGGEREGEREKGGRARGWVGGNVKVHMSDSASCYVDTLKSLEPCPQTSERFEPIPQPYPPPGPDRRYVTHGSTQCLHIPWETAGAITRGRKHEHVSTRTQARLKRDLAEEREHRGASRETLHAQSHKHESTSMQARACKHARP
jgi:hypothetical protein